MKSNKHLFNNRFTSIILIYTFAFIVLMSCTAPVYAQATQLKVIISPIEAVQDGAMWRYKEKNSSLATWSLWWDSGQSMEIFASTFLVEFKETNSGEWVTPDIKKVVVNLNENKVIYQPYHSINAESSIRVILNPDEIQADARWSLYYLYHPSMPSTKTYVAEGLNSGETLTFEMKFNFYYVEYSYVKDLARPYTELVPVSPGINLEISGKYKPLIVGDIHIFGNNLEYDTNEFKTFGITRWAYKYNWGGESVKYFKCSPDLKGSFNPAVIKGRGSLHLTSELGWLDNVFENFNDKIFYDGKFLLDAKTLKTIETSLQKPTFDYIGFSCTTMDFRLFKNPWALSQTIKGELDFPIFENPSIFRIEEFKVSSVDEKSEIIGDVIWEGAEVPGLFKIEETKVHIDTSTKTFTADGFDVVVHTALPSFRGEIRVVDGVVKKLSAELYGIGQKVADWPIIFDNCGFSFAHPNRESVKVGITAGVKFVIPGTTIDAGSESWEGDLDITGHLKVSGKKEIFGYEIGDTETEVQWSGNTQYVSSFIDASYYIAGYYQFMIEGEGYIYLKWKPSFSLNGWIMASGWVPLPDWLQSILPGWLLEQVDDGKINLASFWVSFDAFTGMTISFTLLKSIKISFPIPAFWNNNASNIATVSVAPQDLSKSFTSKTLIAGSVENFTIDQGVPTFILSLQGNSGAPDAVLVKPDGTRIDPRNFVSNDSIHVAIDDKHSVTGFVINNPQPGIWIVELTNSTGVTQRLIRGNHSPQILPVKLESETNGNYKLTYEAFDADNNAAITFYYSPNNTSFQGQKIGTAIENDGTGTFHWDPDYSITSSGYICAVIDDGISQPSQVYFKGRIIGPNAPSAPIFTRAHMSGDSLILTFDDSDFTGIDSLKVYYSDDPETEDLTEYFTVFPKSQIELSNNPMAPGRVYQLRVTTFNDTNGESDFSARLDVDYHLTTGNNYPNIISKPILKPRFFQKTGSNDIYDNQYIQTYNYQLKVQDYDNDPLYYSLIRGPEQLNISGNGLISGEFTNNEVGSKSVVVQVDDGNGGTDIQKFRIDLSSNSQSNAMFLSWSSAQNNLIISLTDVTLNSNSTNIDIITANLFDSVTGIEWIVTLKETSVSSGKFQGLVEMKNGEQSIIRSRKKGFLLHWNNNNGKEHIYRSSSF